MSHALSTATDRRPATPADHRDPIYAMHPVEALQEALADHGIPIFDGVGLDALKQRVREYGTRGHLCKDGSRVVLRVHPLGKSVSVTVADVRAMLEEIADRNQAHARARAEARANARQAKATPVAKRGRRRNSSKLCKRAADDAMRRAKELRLA